LHRGADPVAIAQHDIVTHPNFIAVVEYRRPRHGHQQQVHQFDAVAVVIQQRCKPPADSQVEPGIGIDRIGLVKIIPFAVRNHLQGEFVMVAQEYAPLAILRDIRRLLHDLHHGVAVLLRDGHVHARHEGKMVSHVAFVAIAEILAHILGPLIGFGQEHAAAIMPVHFAAHALDHIVGLRQVFVARALAFAQIRHGVEPHPIHPGIEPEPHHVHDGLEDMRIGEIQIRLMGEEAMPVIRLGILIPAPVGLFGVAEDDARSCIPGVAIAPDVVVALARTGRSTPRRLKPGVLVRRMIDDQFRDHPQAAAMGLFDELTEVRHLAHRGMNVVVVGDIVAVIPPGGRVEGHEPECVHAQLLQIVELRDQAREIANAIPVAVEKCLDVQLVDDGIPVPERVLFQLHSYSLSSG